jgi:hypothetical protein
MVAGAAGVACLLGLLGVPANPVSGDEAATLIDQYNRRLREGAGLAADPDLGLAPSIFPGGAGLSFSSRF